MEKSITVAIIGCGSRGIDSYGKLFYSDKNRWKIVSLCDINEIQLNVAKEKLNVKNNCFLSEEKFFLKKRADLLVIATQDRDHTRMCLKGLELGYDILLEKPISPIREELEAILAAQKKYGGKVMVCHVLRYSLVFRKIKEVLDSKKLGRLIGIESLEQVGFWHQAHSYVRGNWRKAEETTPMLMAKCCHDLDLLQYYVDSKCEQVYSMGALTFFKKENQPIGASERCENCRYKKGCIYSAENLYVERWKEQGEPEDAWPFNVVDRTFPITEKSLRKAYETTPYGRCVFACDNDVVDYQSVMMRFENGVTVTHTMTAYTEWSGRKMTFHCTHGSIELDETGHSLKIFNFGNKPEYLDTRELIADLKYCGKYFGHGGSEIVMMEELYQLLCNDSDNSSTTLEKSIESHLIAIAAEESRKSGCPINIRKQSTK